MEIIKSFKLAGSKAGIMLAACAWLVLSSCSIAPVYRAWRPWTRTLGDSVIQAGARIAVEVTGEQTNLVGSEELFQSELGDELVDLLLRRGYKADDGDVDYHFKLEYCTSRERVSDMTTAVTSSSSSALAMATAAGSYSSYGFGAAIASSVQASISKSSNKTVQRVRSYELFHNVIALQCFDHSGKLCWTGESTWDSENENAIGEIAFALRMLVSNLPRIELPIKVPAIREGRGEDFIDQHARRSFSSPALPYRLWFVWGENGKSIGLRDAEFALAGFLDLASNSEFAVPEKRYAWDNPTARENWAKVKLGGWYEIQGEKHFLMMKLLGSQSGYHVSKISIATEEERLAYLESLADWQERLREYYNVYSW